MKLFNVWIIACKTIRLNNIEILLMPSWEGTKLRNKYAGSYLCIPRQNVGDGLRNIWGHTRRVLTCDNASSWQLHSAAPNGRSDHLQYEWFPIQSDYHDTGVVSYYQILVIHKGGGWVYILGFSSLFRSGRQVIGFNMLHHRSLWGFWSLPLQGAPQWDWTRSLNPIVIDLYLEVWVGGWWRTGGVIRMASGAVVWPWRGLLF